MKPNERFLILAVSLFVPVLGWCGNWPQYRGPNNDGSTPEKILTKWPMEGPRVVWKAELGPSFGSFAVSGDRAFCFIQRKVGGEDREVAIALDANSGKELWAAPLGKATYDKQGGDGPRSTPTVDGDRVYFLGAYQVLTCLNAADGKQIWQHDLVKEHGGKIIKWNNAASPVTDGKLIFVNAGGPGEALLAFDKADGKVVWKGEDDLPTHASPVLATIHGVKQVIFFTQKGLVATTPAEGRVLWRHSYPFKVSTASSPIVSGDVVYCSAAYDVGAGAVRVTKKGDEFSATELWRTPGKLPNHWTTPVCKDGYIYGIFGHGKAADAPLKCLEIATGKEMWSQPNVGGGGATVLVGDNILVQTDRGPLVLVAANPKAYKELARAQIYGGQCWTMAVVSNGKIFGRNTKEGFCLDVTSQSAAK
jgi:outer membrane protein assembly factor BamB